MAWIKNKNTVGALHNRRTVAKTLRKKRERGGRNTTKIS